MELSQKQLRKLLLYLIILSSLLFFGCGSFSRNNNNNIPEIPRAPKYNATDVEKNISKDYSQKNWYKICNDAIAYLNEPSIIWTVFSEQPEMYAILLQALIIYNKKSEVFQCFSIVPLSRVREKDYYKIKNLLYFYDEAYRDWNSLVFIARNSM